MILTLKAEAQLAHYGHEDRHRRDRLDGQIHAKTSRRRRTRLERLVATAVILQLLSASQSTVSSFGFPFAPQPLPSVGVSKSSTTSSSSSKRRRRHFCLSTLDRQASSSSSFSFPLRALPESSVSDNEADADAGSSSIIGTATWLPDGKDQTTADATARDAIAFPISRAYQRQMRALMEASRIQQQEHQQELELDDSSGMEDDNDDIVNIASSSSSSFSLSNSHVDVAVSQEEYQRGLLTIGFCTLVFASMSPAMHACLVCTSDQTAAAAPPPVLLLNAAVSVVALVGLVLAGPFLERVIPKPSTLLLQVQTEQQQQLAEQQSSSSSTNHKATIIELSSKTLMMNRTKTASSLSSLLVNGNNPFTISSITNRAGLELGLWKFLGTTANLFGLSLTSADHGAFLIQLTTLIVPTVQGIMGVPIPQRIQGSIALALAGVALFTQDFSAVTASASAAVVSTTDVDTAAAALLLSTTTATRLQQQLTGDALCVLAAIFYATYDLRLYEWGKRVAPRELITTKIAAQALFSLALLLSAPGAWSESVSFFQTIVMNSSSNVGSDPTQILMLVPLVLWSGFMVNAIVPFLQVGGQQAIGPTRAQTLYASQPLWAAIMSYFFLGETVGVQGLVGGGAFMAALFLAATTAKAAAPEENNNSATIHHHTEASTAATSEETLESKIFVEKTRMQLARQERY